MSAFALPETLKSVTATKIEELGHQRDLFEEQKSSLFREVSRQQDALSKARCLLEGTCKIQKVRLPSDNTSDDRNDEHVSTGPIADALRNKHFLLRQAAADPAIAESLVADIYSQLEHDFEIKSTQHLHAKFFSDLVTEWLSDSNGGPDSPNVSDTDASFEDVGRKEMHEQRQTWEQTVFSSSSVDTTKIVAYLEHLFHSSNKAKKAHESLVKSIHRFCAELTEQKDIFTPARLEIYIKGLLSTDLLSDQRSSTLKTFTSNKEVLKEVSDVLNMRWQSLQNWRWTTFSGAIPVEMRKQLNGKYRVFMDEDVLDALLLYVIGLKFSVHFNRVFRDFVAQAFLRPGTQLSKSDRGRREYYLGQDSKPSSTVQTERHKIYTGVYFMTQLPQNENVGKRDYDDDDSTSGTGERDQKSPMELKHGLLHLLVADALIAQHVDPQSKHTVVRSDFKWFGPSIPHETIQTILRFFGVEENWLTIFERFLQAPLRFGQDGPNAQIRVRSRGVPMSHTLSDVFGESILFVMDFCVNQATSSNMYRLHDDFWFWGPEELCITGWNAMTKFASVMGLDFNQEKTGTVTFGKKRATSKHLPKGDVAWGFLRLDAETNSFVVNREMVGEHVKELRLQLSYCKSIFSYVQCYNAYLARFFTNNFGKPSFGFGRGHVDMMVDTFARIQAALFPEASVSTYLNHLATQRFEIDDLPVGFWYWPVDLGGLELQNPNIPLIAMRETMRQSPQSMLAKALDADEAAYTSAKEHFKLHSTSKGLSNRLFLDKEMEREIAAAKEDFMPRDEYLRFRVERSPQLGAVYKQLLLVPDQEEITETAELKSWVATIRHDSPKYITSDFDDMQPYWKWILALYGKEIMHKYASVQLVDQEKVPLGVVSLIKSGKIRWKG